MSETETRQYIEHRLTLVGWRNDPAISDEACALIHRQAEGVPRLTNLLCNRLLLFGALEGRHDLDADAVREVVEDMRGELTGPPHGELTGPPRGGDVTRVPSLAGPLVTPPGTPANEARLTVLEERLARQERVLRSVMEASLDILPEVHSPRPPSRTAANPNREAVHD
jgi:hypothetical protein